MRQIPKVALLALLVTAKSISTGDDYILKFVYSRRNIAMESRLPRIPSLPQLEQFNHLPYPRNYIAAYRDLDKVKRGELKQHLKEQERHALESCKELVKKQFPHDVLAFMEIQLNREHNGPWWKDRPWQEFAAILKEHPELITTPFQGLYVVSEDGRSCVPATPDFTQAFRVPSSETTTLAKRAVQTHASGLLERILEAGFDPRTKFFASHCPDRTQKSFLEFPHTYRTVLTNAAREKNTATEPNRYQQLVSALESNIHGLGSDAAKFILDFTPLEAVVALQAYREKGRSLLDMELEKLRTLIGSSDSNKHDIPECRDRIRCLITCGVLAEKQPALLEQHMQEEGRRQRKKKRRYATISACTAVMAGLTCWWFTKK